MIEATYACGCTCKLPEWPGDENVKGLCQVCHWAKEGLYRPGKNQPPEALGIDEGTYKALLSYVRNDPNFASVFRLYVSGDISLPKALAIIAIKKSQDLHELGRALLKAKREDPQRAKQLRGIRQKKKG